MNIDEIKKIWQEEHMNLEKRIRVSENNLLQINLQKSKNTFESYFKKAILGRNIALAYMVTSIIFAVLNFGDFAYSLPALFGGMAMLFSFIQHSKLKKPDLNKSSILEIQKSISQFRIHIAKHAKYDILIYAIWFLTLLPLYLKSANGIFIYSNPSHLVKFLAMAILFIILLLIGSKMAYRNWATDLEKEEASLEGLLKFEQF